MESKTNNQVVLRIEEYFLRNKYNAASFAREINISKQTVYDWLKGRTAPQLEHLAIILRKFSDLDANWLFIGEKKDISNSTQIVSEPENNYKKKKCENCEKLEIDKDGLYMKIRELQTELDECKKYLPKEKRRAS